VIEKDEMSRRLSDLSDRIAKVEQRSAAPPAAPRLVKPSDPPISNNERLMRRVILMAILAWCAIVYGIAAIQNWGRMGLLELLALLAFFMFVGLCGYFIVVHMQIELAKSVWRAYRRWREKR